MKWLRTHFWRKALGIAGLAICSQFSIANDLTSQATYQPIDIASTTIFTPSELRSLVEKYAPQLRFDKAATDFPMSAQEWYQSVIVDQTTTFLENTDSGKLSAGKIPTYYKVWKFGNQIRINYWWYYGNQDSCGYIDGEWQGAHTADWENITVILSEFGKDIIGIKYNQHGGWYTRFLGQYETVNGTHPVVYVGKISHGSYHNQGGHYDTISKACDYFDDYRKPSETNYYWDTQSNLVPMSVGVEPWMAADLAGTFRWGREPGNNDGNKGIGNHPMQYIMQANFDACEKSFGLDTVGDVFKGLFGTEEGGCHSSYQSCLAGDSKKGGDDYCFTAAIGADGAGMAYSYHRYDMGLGSTDAGYLYSKNCGVLGIGNGFYPGTSRYSCDGLTQLDFSADGRLSVYKYRNGQWSWATEITHQPTAAYAVVQDDGNFVVRDAENNALWATGTHNKGQNGNDYEVFGMHIQNDGNVVIYRGKAGLGTGSVRHFSPIWDTNTND